MAINRVDGVRVASVGSLLAENLTIPSYQRPYRWEPSTALQLLDDICDALRTQRTRAEQNARHGGTGAYVLGAVILHNDGESLNVVDGQQRLLTLLMLRDILTAESHEPADGEAATTPIALARQALASRVQLLAEDRNEVASFIDEYCELIRVETDDADEAFRVFDSQNYRGKALLPHDLLKAHHLRALNGVSRSMQSAIVEAWQQVPDAELDRLFAVYLWRIHRWSRGMHAPPFSMRHIDVFKGLKEPNSPFARYHLAAQAAVPMLAAWHSGEHDVVDERDAGRSRFQLDAPIGAGRPFFEMVAYMLSEVRRVRTEAFDRDWEPFASSSEALRELASRSRYRYVSELYIASLLYYTNRFGDVELPEARQRLFKWSFSLRTSFQRVQLVTVNNYARGTDEIPSAFAILRNATSPADLRALSARVRGRDQDPEHEVKLLQLLNKLVG